MADHGLLFDQFPATRRSEHGGSQFDEGFSEQAVNDAHGKLYDLFGVPRDADLLKGEHFDEFGWKDVPVGHGALFDSDFRTEVPDSPHGTWFDALDGAQVRFVCNGVNLEGTVINVKDDYATVSTSGSEVEVSLQQFLQYRSPALDNHSPGLPDETAEELPSARNETAHGAFDGARSTPSTGERVDHVSPGPGNTDERIEAPAGLNETFQHLKTAVEGLDVEKSAVPFKSEPTHGAGPGADHTVEDNPFNRQHAGHLIGKSFCVKHAPSYTKLGPAAKGAKCDHADCGGTVRYGMSGTTRGLGNAVATGAWTPTKKTLDESLEVLKDVSSAETATQGDPDDGEGGKCPTCGHEVVAKSGAGWMVGHDSDGYHHSECHAGTERVHSSAVPRGAKCATCKQPVLGPAPDAPKSWAAKDSRSALDVLKEMSQPTCPGCQHAIGTKQATVEHPTTHAITHAECAEGYAKSVAWKPDPAKKAAYGAAMDAKIASFQGRKASVGKSMDSTETATQGGATDVVKHRKGCPRSGGGPCGAINEDGKCSACQASVRDHEVIGKRAPDGTPGNEHIVNNGCQHCGKPMNPVDAMVGMQRDGKLVCHDCAKGLHSAAAAGKVFKPRPWTGKSLDDTLDVLKGLGKKGRIGSTDQQLDAPEIAHSDKQIEEENSPQSAGKARVVEGDPGVTPEKRGKPSDHNMPAEGEQRTCPHCGHILAKEAELAEQGAPSHKCAGSGLDALKTLVTA